MFLNKQIKLCTEPEAAFQSVTPRADRSRNILDDQRLETYNSDLTEAAELRSQSLPVNPVEKGDNKKWKMEIGGFRFHWHDNSWEHYWDGHCIQIVPNVDKTEIEIFLATFTAFKKGVFTRSRIQNEPMVFILGANDNYSKGCVASARVRIRGTSRPGEIRLPCCKNGHHLIANQVGAVLQDQGFNNGLRGILLHEIGHTLKRDFPDEREKLRAMTANRWEKLMTFLDEISPHYLGAQKNEILEKLQLKELVLRLPDLTQTERSETEDELTEYAQKIGAELFAEMGRYYYLEPCITRKQPTIPHTELPAFDDFAALLLDEAQLNRTQDDATYPAYRGPEMLD